MYSQEFIRFLFNYQKPEFKKDIYKETKHFGMRSKLSDLATVVLLNKK